MLKKIIKVGNSAALTIPKDFLKQTNLKIGDKVLVNTDVVTKNISFAPFKKTYSSIKISSWSSKFIKKYQPVLEELAKK